MSPTPTLSQPHPLNAPTASGTAAVTVDNAAKSFGTTTVLSRMNLHITPGEAIGILGPNGAGKSTLLSLITGERSPDAGSVTIFGANPRTPEARRRMGVTPQATSLPEVLKVREVLDFVAAHYPNPLPASELLDDLDLTALAGKQCGGLSGGQKRRVMLAVALVGNPDMLVLDEPTTGLDVESRQQVWQRIQAFSAAGGTLLVTSHHFDEIECLADRVVMLADGQIVVDDQLERVRTAVELRHVTVTLPDTPEAVITALPGVTGFQPGEGARRVITCSDSDAFIRALITEGLPFADLEVRGASLEEAVAVHTAGH
ncbi:ABC transporter ATP-binding protein [Brevibacterium luteolum]|uniref:ABC transporter ATP-binding protein n=1 Tax=Brevibacterium luteolum TaxID=199591 RepID=A0A2N6PKB6_9MICO|nr:ABC transporter ATP-binding protein [Brevibacterium luteolum]PMB99140.1 ABC transporter ATP-binding protein [Brevibacterium luteolum]